MKQRISYIQRLLAQVDRIIANEVPDQRVQFALEICRELSDHRLPRRKRARRAS